jgi:hypothetical protein
MAVARYYRRDKDNGGDLFGTPKRDIEEDEWARYPEWQKATIDASPAYQVTNPHPAPRKRADDEKEG